MDIQSAFSGVSVGDLDAAKKFYTEVLGLELLSEEMGLRFQLPDGGTLFMYLKPNHQPAAYTFLNFVVKNIDEAVDELSGRGVHFERYEGMHQDEKGIARGLEQNMGPDIAWFTDPAANILGVLQPE